MKSARIRRLGVAVAGMAIALVIGVSAAPVASANTGGSGMSNFPTVRAGGSTGGSGVNGLPAVAPTTP